MSKRAKPAKPAKPASVPSGKMPESEPVSKHPLRLGWDIHRRMKWEDPDKMAEAIDRYFDETPPPYFEAHLALYLGFSCRQSFWNYTKREAFREVIQYAKTRIEAWYMHYGFVGKNFTFADRMLTRLGYPCVEKSENDTNVRILPPEIK